MKKKIILALLPIIAILFVFGATGCDSDRAAYERAQAAADSADDAYEAVKRQSEKTQAYLDYYY